MGDRSVQKFFPELTGCFEELGIDIVYARQFMDPAESPASHDRWMRAKADAIAVECGNLYSKHQDIWTNVIVIGDSDFEIIGSEQILKRWAYENRRIALQLPRLKSVKFLD